MSFFSSQSKFIVLYNMLRLFEHSLSPNNGMSRNYNFKSATGIAKGFFLFVLSEGFAVDVNFSLFSKKRGYGF